LKETIVGWFLQWFRNTLCRQIETQTGYLPYGRSYRGGQELAHMRYIFGG